jgi:hypothetical protein
VLAGIDSNNKANLILIEKLTEIVSKLDSAKPTLTSDDLQKILIAIKDIKIPPTTLTLVEPSEAAVIKAMKLLTRDLTEQLDAIKDAAKGSQPRRTIHAVTEGSSK